MWHSVRVALLRVTTMLVVSATGLIGCADSPLENGRALQDQEPLFSLDGPAMSVDVGTSHACAVGTDGKVACWGASRFQQTSVPTALGSVSAVAAGGAHTCAVRVDGTVACWGDGSSGQTTIPALGRVTKLSAGEAHTCAVTDDGTAVCWGSNQFGEADVPASLGSVIQVSAGAQLTCAIKPNAGVVCWGRNDAGQANVPATLGAASQVSVGGAHSCALRTGGSVVCWGDNSLGQTAAPASLNATQVSSGGHHTCALRTDGTVACWGYSGFGQTFVPVGLSGVVQVNAGGNQTCALKSDGTIVCWGALPGRLLAGSYSQVSAGWIAAGCALRSDGKPICWGGFTLNNVPSNLGTPTKLTTGAAHACVLNTAGSVVCWGQSVAIVLNPPAGLGPVSDVSAGIQFTCAIAGAGNVVCWGLNDRGQTTVPTDLGTATQVSAGQMHACAVRGDGTVRCWGMNLAGQTNVPPTLTGVAQVSAGGVHSCARKSDGSVVCWGFNGLGAVAVPPGLGPVTQVATGNHHTCALKSDGGVACWGSNTSGQTTVPVDLGTAVQISAGQDQTCAVKSDNTIECWGDPASTTYLPPSPPPPTLFAQGPRASSESHSLRSNVENGFGSLETTQQVADRFMLATRSQLHSVSWEGTYFQRAVSTASVAFRIQVYANLSQPPLYDASLSARYTQVGTSEFGSPIYRFTATLPGLILEAATPYWIAILDSDPNTNIDFRWWKTAIDGSGDYAVRSSASATWSVMNSDVYHDFVVELAGTSISPGATEPGSDVNVHPVDATTGADAPVELTFATITSAGETTVSSGTIGQGGPPAPEGFRVGNPPTYYDVQTTATFSGSVELCFDYSSASYGNENILKLLHYENGVWTDVTTSLDVNSNIICGVVTSLSPFLVAEENAAPLVTGITLPQAPVPVETSVTVTATFTDANPGDTHTATIDWDDGTTSNASVSESNGARTASGSRSYSAPGVYTVTATVSDGDLSGTRSSNSDQPAYIVVYDPSSGFVTGGGWFDSPAGACVWSGCAADGSTTGKAAFGFVSRYKKGATTPTGNTEFQFKAGGLSFQSSSYQWLVVAGARAKYKGEGQIAGDPSTYGFLITAVDGALSGGGGVDRFRIKIWNVATGEVVYDNQMGALDDSEAATAIGGGSIVIHQ